MSIITRYNVTTNTVSNNNYAMDGSVLDGTTDEGGTLSIKKDNEFNLFKFIAKPNDCFVVTRMTWTDGNGNTTEYTPTATGGLHEEDGYWYFEIDADVCGGTAFVQFEQIEGCEEQEEEQED